MATTAQATTLTAPQEQARTTVKAKRKRIPGAKKLRMKELPTFTRQMAAMLSSGMPVVQTLVALEEQQLNKNFKNVIAGVRSLIEGGYSFSDALSKFPDVFDELYVSMLRAGETGGLLAETTARIATYLESSARLRRKVVSAMTYPVIVLFIVIGITSALIIFIVPKFAEIYSDFGAKLPGPTQFLVNVSYACRRYSLIVIAIIVGISIAFKQFKKSATGSFMWDGFTIRFPLLGELAKKIALARFSSTFAQLMRSGVPILHALEIVAFATGNKVLAKTILEGRADVERGEPLSTTLGKDKNYPRMLVHMLSAGEQTGKVEDMLQKIAEFYDDEVETMLAGLTSLIEPLMIVFLGVTVGGIVVCMFMPIFKLHEVVSM
ncbi:MAG: type II secretion system F family protein [Kiritimatiellae bacterium]|nr:type II secretion system F family protein [Kiritimatiellia bacterium]